MKFTAEKGHGPCVILRDENGNHVCQLAILSLPSKSPREWAEKVANALCEAFPPAKKD